MSLLIALLPWIGVILFIHGFSRFPRELTPADAAEDAPSVTVIVPARNEEANLERCLASLAETDYPNVSVVVVNDRSIDATGEIARRFAEADDRFTAIEGAQIDLEWLGKPWACHQGALHADGDLLLFTDADTEHGPHLLRNAVGAVDEENADLLTLVGRQEMGSFWERLVQPQVFMTMAFRFPNFERTARNARWREAIANGQYMLFRRSAYEAIGGHECVRDEVVEDMALAQHVKRAGLNLRMRGAMESFSTRMYRSLSGLIEGWTKNLVIGGQQSLPRGLRTVAAPSALLFGVTIWLVPPVALLVGLTAAGMGSSAVGGLQLVDLLVWAGAACALTALNMALFMRRMHGPVIYSLLYPLGAAMGTYIFARSWRRGRLVEWKGRTYMVPSVADRL